MPVRWIRPVDGEDREMWGIDEASLRVAAKGDNPESWKPLDVFNVLLREKCPQPPHEEHQMVELAEGSWEKVEMAKKVAFEQLSKIEEMMPKDGLWQKWTDSDPSQKNDKNDRVAPKMPPRTGSVRLIRVKDWYAYPVSKPGKTGKDEKAEPQVRAKFEFNGVEHDLAVRDPRYVRDVNSHCKDNEKPGYEYQDQFLIISLTYKFSPEKGEGKEWCYKVVAGAIEASGPPIDPGVVAPAAVGLGTGGGSNASRSTPRSRPGSPPAPPSPRPPAPFGVCSSRLSARPSSS